MVAMITGCGTGIRISNLPDKRVVTDSGSKTHTVTTKIGGVTTKEVITTDKWDRKQTDNRPFWSIYGYPYYGRGGYIR